MSRAFSEDSRVKFPTIMHLVTMGYEYVSLNGVKKFGVTAVEFDPLTMGFVKGNQDLMSLVQIQQNPKIN